MNTHQHPAASASGSADHAGVASDSKGLNEPTQPQGDGRIDAETLVQIVADMTPGMLAYWDQQLRCRFANDQYREWFGKTHDQMLGIRIQDLMGEDLFRKNEPFIRAALAGQKQTFERQLVKNNGEVSWVEARYEPHKLGDTVVGFVALVLDINELKTKEQALQASAARLLDAQAAANIGSWETDLSNFNVVWSPQTYNIFDVDITTFTGSHTAFLEFVHPQDRAIVDAAFLKSFEQPGWNAVQHRILSAAGVTKHVKERWRIERDEQGTPLRALGTCQDISEWVTLHEAQKQIADRLAMATRAGGVGTWDYNIVGNELVWDAAMYTLYGITPSQFGGAYEAWRNGVHPDDQARGDEEIQQAIRGEKEFDTEFRVLWPNGEVHNIRAIAIVQRDDDGRALRMIGTNWDITDSVRYEENQRALLREKDALLKEVHHRVKNNLQVITSLLRFEAARSKMDETKTVLGDMKGRIYAMAQLHESLYRKGSFASVDLGFYLGQLATQTFRSQTVHADLVRLQLNLGQVRVGMDQATAAGLVLNELISNCLKHGFPDGRVGTVSVELQPAPIDTSQTRSNVWCLHVGDTGVGLPEDFEERRKHSLGLQLISDLASQLGGTLIIDSPPLLGAQFSVVFTALEPEELRLPV